MNRIRSLWTSGRRGKLVVGCGGLAALVGLCLCSLVAWTQTPAGRASVATTNANQTATRLAAALLVPTGTTAPRSSDTPRPTETRPPTSSPTRSPTNRPATSTTVPPSATAVPPTLPTIGQAAVPPTSVPPTTRPVQVQPTQPPPTAPVGPASLRVTGITNRGTTEWVTIQNAGGTAQPMTGWSIQSYNGNRTNCIPLTDQVYPFPGDFVLEPGASVNIYSGPVGGTTARSANALPWTPDRIWNDDGDRADLRAPGGNVVSTFSYGQCRN